MISKYNDFLLESEFNSLITEMLLILETEGKWTSDRTYEWDFNQKEIHNPDWIENITNRVKNFVKKIPKEKVKGYFIKLMNSLLNFPDNIRKKMLVGYLGAFLTIANIGYLTSSSDDSDELNPKIENEIKNLIKKNQKKSSFQKAQKLVKSIEAGYSSDRKDLGNWIEIPGHGQRFVGTNHGISAPVLKEWLGRYPKKEDMLNLTYEEALEIYKNKYWEPQNLSYFENQSIANLIYDGCVNQGVGAMSEILIEAYKKGGIEISESPFSISSIELANSLDQEKLFSDIKYLREKKYKRAKTWTKHGKGWLKRLDLLTYQDSENKNGFNMIKLKRFEKYSEPLEFYVEYYLQHVRDDGFEIQSSDDFFRIYKPILSNIYRYDNLKSFSYKEIYDDVQRFIDAIENSYNINYIYIIRNSPLGENERIIVDKNNLYELDKINSVVIVVDKF